MRSSSRTEASLSWSGAKHKTFGQILTRGPAEMTAAEKMEMEMEDGLARPAAIVYDGAVAFQKMAFPGKLRGGQLQFAKNVLMFGGGLVQRFEMFARANQDVRGRLRADVFEGKKISIFIDDLRWNFLRRDFAEQTVGTHRFPPAGKPSSRRVTNGVKPSRSWSCSPNWRAAFSPEILPTRTR